MIKFNPFWAVLTAVILVIILVSCNNSSDEVPFPENELGSSRPVTVPLQFSAEKKMTWDTVRHGDINSSIKKLDIDQLPSTPYDTSGFKPFSVQPDTCAGRHQCARPGQFHAAKREQRSIVPCGRPKYQHAAASAVQAAPL